MTFKRFTVLYLSIAVSVFLSATALLEAGAYLMISRSNRLPSVRDINENYRMYFIKDFIKKKFDPDKEYIIVIGDSQFYGFREDEADTFPAIIANDMNLNVINLSIQGGTAADMGKILKCLNEIKIRFIFYNLNINHFVKWLEGSNIMTEETYLPESVGAPILNAYTLGAQTRYFFNITPHYPFHQNATTPSEEMEGSNLHKMPKRSFDVVLEKNGILFELCRSIRSFPNHLIVASPQFMENFKFNGYDLNKIREFLQGYEIALKGEKMRFVDMTFDFERSDFIDEIHLNKKGHRKMAKVLEKYLEAMP